MDRREQPEVWVILALIVERPGHGYELIRRYEDRLGSFLPLSAPRVYDALELLRGSKLIEPIEPRRPDRRVRRAYRATQKGIRARRRWLTKQMANDPELMTLLGPLVSAKLLSGREIIEVLSAYELRCKREIRALAVNGSTEDASLGELALMLGEEALLRKWEARPGWAADARELIQSHE